MNYKNHEYRVVGTKVYDKHGDHLANIDTVHDLTCVYATNGQLIAKARCIKAFTTVAAFAVVQTAEYYLEENLT